MAGHMISLVLGDRGHEVLSIQRTEALNCDRVDVEKNEDLRNYIISKKPDVVVNCVGVLIKESEDNPERSIRINSLLPRMLSRLGRENHFRLIHLSSDCVFSGRNGPYSEEDFRDADDVYGRTKALGEIINDRDLTIRTSIVGPDIKKEGSGLFSWFMRQRGTIKGYACAMWGGVTTLELAKAIDILIAEGTTGLVHLTNGKAISKYDLLKLFQILWERDDVVIEFDESYISYRGLRSSRMDFQYIVPSYRAMLEDMKAFMVEHEELYCLYEKNTINN